MSLSVNDLILLDEEGNRTVEEGDPITYLPCLRTGCLAKFRLRTGIKDAQSNLIAKRVYGIQKVVCPHCGQKLKVRCYKKGDVSIELRNK